MSQEGNDQRVPRTQTPPESVELNIAAETVGNAKSYVKHPEGSSTHTRGQQGAAETKYNKSSQNREPEKHEQILIGLVEIPAFSETGTKERVPQQALPVAQLDANVGRELEAVRHHGSPRSVGISGTECAMLAAIAAPHSLEPPSGLTVIHFSGERLDTRPLQFDSQFTKETTEMSSITCLSTNETPSHVILLDVHIRGYDPGTPAHL